MKFIFEENKLQIYVDILLLFDKNNINTIYILNLIS